MSHTVPTQAEIEHALLAMGAGFKIEHQENDLMGNPEPVLVMRGPVISVATVKHLQDQGLIQATADENDHYEPSPEGMQAYYDLIVANVEQPVAKVAPVANVEAFVAEGHGYYIPPPVRPAVKPVPVASEFEA